jgi:hypothetical protein
MGKNIEDFDFSGFTTLKVVDLRGNSQGLSDVQLGKIPSNVKILG